MSLKRLFPKFDAFCHRLNCSFNRTQIKHKSLDRFGTWKVHNVPLTHCLHITSQADCTITCYFITFAFNFRDNSLYFSVILVSALLDCIYLYHKTWSSYIPHQHDIMTSPVATSELPDFIAFWSIKSTTLTTTTFVKSGSDQTLIFDAWKSTLLKWCMCFFSILWRFFLFNISLCQSENVQIQCPEETPFQLHSWMKANRSHIVHRLVWRYDILKW